jgi:dihydroxyacetone kinase phosphotransfer subunit
MTAPRVALVLVSHSAALAAGAAELAAQMAPGVTILPAGGGDDGGLGTSFTTITNALTEADGPAGTVVLYDLGSARLTTDTALEFLDPDAAARITIVDAPLAEGALAAAVTARSGAPRPEVAAAARQAAAPFLQPAPGPAPGTTTAGVPTPGGETGPETAAATRVPATPAAVAHRTVAVRNRLGLHARPVAEMIGAVRGFDAQLHIGRAGEPPASLRSLLAVVALAIRGGDTAEITASGPDARAAADRVAALIESGFGEPAQPAPGSLQPGAAPARSKDPAAPSPPTTPDPPTTPPPGTTFTPATPATPSGPRAGASSGSSGGAGSRAPGAPPVPAPAGPWTATPGSPGRAIGPVVRLAGLDVPDRAGAGTAAETGRLAAAVDAAAAALAASGEPLGPAHAAVVRDPDLASAAHDAIGRGLGAESAWWRATEEAAGRLAASGDELVAARAADVREAGAAVLAALGVAADRIPPDGLLLGAVLVAGELGPGEVTRVAERGGVAIVLSAGSVTAHAVLVARNLGLPLVLGAGPRAAELAPGTVLDVNGSTGELAADPQDLAARRAAVARQKAGQDRLRAAAAGPVTFRGRRILVEANIGSAAEARAAVAAGADGAGLLRTELLLPDQPALPGEDVQHALLSEIFAVFGDRPVTVRVLDPGGDKPLMALRLDPVRNGFLGIRGWRWLAAHPAVLRTQLRAICRAAPGHTIDVLAPMITVAAEARAFRAAVGAAADSLIADGIAHARPRRIGAMIEVPAAALAADEIAAEADFLSVGTNDLIAYTMAADRTLPGVAGLADPAATAVWRLLEQICAGAARHGRPVAVCGELAGDERFARRLAGVGVSGLSMAAGRIPAIKALLRQY